MAQLLEYIKMALMNIKSNKGRSVLTMLGIIIGISSVIMIISIGNGISDEISGELNKMAGGQIYLYSEDNNEAEAVRFTIADCELIEEKIPHVKGVTPQYSMYGTALGKKGDFDAYVYAGTESLEYMSPDPIVRGRYFTRADYEDGNRVCVLREGGAIAMFGTTDVIGKTFEVTIYNQTIEIKVVGIRKDDASALMNMVNYYNTVEFEMPLTTFVTSIGLEFNDFGDMLIISEGPEYANDVASTSIRLMENIHDVRGKGVIKLQNFNDSMQQITSVLDYITIFVVFVAAISLLVGGIGVMNIMLVSVTERTREIGIRKALGARTGSIMLQFLSESAIITLIGGLIGIATGAAGAYLVCSLIGFQAQVEPGTVILASVFSSGVGIFFGIYPAKRAAKLSPIEALRHE
ncbi:MAG: ABC transporter permease [Lachnospiraceae bacterium]|nr:ABC transporter permease [Lachnospiraceae bacterium]